MQVKSAEIQQAKDGIIPILMTVPFNAENKQWADTFSEKVKAGKVHVIFLEDECK